MTTTTKPTILNEALETAIIEALKETEALDIDFPAMSKGDLNEFAFVKYREIMPNNLPSKTLFNYAFNKLLEDLVERHVIKSYHNRFMHQYRLVKPKTLPVDTFSKEQLKHIYEFSRHVIDNTKNSEIDGTLAHHAHINYVVLFSEKGLLNFMDIAAKTNQKL